MFFNIGLICRESLKHQQQAYCVFCDFLGGRIILNVPKSSIFYRVVILFFLYPGESEHSSIKQSIQDRTKSQRHPFQDDTISNQGRARKKRNIWTVFFVLREQLHVFASSSNILLLMYCHTGRGE